MYRIRVGFRQQLSPTAELLLQVVILQGELLFDAIAGRTGEFLNDIKPASFTFFTLTNYEEGCPVVLSLTSPQTV